MELKGIIAEKNIICITSYDNPEHHTFHAKNLIKALQMQSKKVLVVDVSNTLKDIQAEHYINFSGDENLKLTSTDIQNMIREKIKDTDLCIINNQAIRQGKMPLLFLKIADQNLFLLDSRKTATKSIMNVELLKDEYKLDNLWFILNKEGYNPSILTTIKKLIQKK
ncbi:MAG: hypothetical protein L0G39_15505 [Chryseobacterium sp.]|nr:hypothetical protein [Chryseobacterium sp.]